MNLIQVIKSFKQVFSNVRYVLIAGTGAFGFLAISAILPNLRLMRWVMGSEAMAADEKLYFFTNVIAGGFKMDLVSFAAFFIFTIAILFGANIAMSAYYFKSKSAILKQGGVAGFFGAFAGFLGVGCSACGSIALSSLLSLVGAAGALTYLPLGGREFAILSIFLLLLSIYQISRNISISQTCNANL